MTELQDAPPLIPVDVIHDILREVPGQDWREIRQILSLRGYRSISRYLLNHQLYRHGQYFRKESENGGRPRWYAVGSPSYTHRTQPAPPVLERPITRLELSLYPWQEKALQAWQEAECRGVVEAVTGAGKTRVALAASYEHLREGGKVTVVVPSIPLQEQWRKEFERCLHPAFPNLRIGQLGGGKRDSLRDFDVLIATVASASGALFFAFDHNCLLIADECHRYGADTWHEALQQSFKKRLGLTATYEREDNGVERYLNPYFGGVCYHVDYKEALRDGVIAPFKIAFVGTRFTPEELVTYEEMKEKAGKYRWELIKHHGVTPEPFGEFMADVSWLRANGTGRGAMCAGLYLNAFAKQRATLANAQGKLQRLIDLVPAIRAAERTILFAQTQDAAETAIGIVGRIGIQGAVLHSGMKMLARRKVLASFECGDEELVAAPKLLDEGIDVPAADLAIVLASSRSRRQMIQRMGRVLRKKQDGRMARLVVLYVEGTIEDPAQGAHQTFLQLVREAASDERDFQPDASGLEIARYLNRWSAV